MSLLPDKKTSLTIAIPESGESRTWMSSSESVQLLSVPPRSYFHFPLASETKTLCRIGKTEKARVGGMSLSCTQVASLPPPVIHFITSNHEGVSMATSPVLPWKTSHLCLSRCIISTNSLPAPLAVSITRSSSLKLVISSPACPHPLVAVY
jgi:hypothetical protein